LVFPRPGADYVAPGKKKKRPRIDEERTMKKLGIRRPYATSSHLVTKSEFRLLVHKDFLHPDNTWDKLKAMELGNILSNLPNEG
jgi:hypothetical protein